MKGTIYSLPTDGQVGRIKRQHGYGLVRFTQEDIDQMVQGTRLAVGAPVEFDEEERESGKYAINLRPAILDPASDPDEPATDPQPPALPAEAPAFAPYTFVPIHTNGEGHTGLPLFQPVFHQGSSEAELLSGTLHLELRSLAPLLVGQYRYPVKKWLPDFDCDDEKQMLEPLFIQLGKQGVATCRPPDPRPKPNQRDAWAKRHTVLPATSIKGPVRHNIGAMLNAPMERVAERLYSYRPNLNVKADRHGQQYHCYAAVITNDSASYVRLVKNLSEVIFVEHPQSHDETKTERASDEATHQIGEALTIGRPLRNPLDGYDKDHNRLLYTGNGSWSPPAQAGYRVYTYATGIDGECLLASAIKAKATNPSEFRFKHHFRALVSDGDLMNPPLALSPAVKKRYEATKEALTNKATGHLDHFPGKEKLKDQLEQAKTDIAKQDPSRHQLIFVEARLENDKPVEIVSFGTHFYYRWRYANSVREVLMDALDGRTCTRPELCAPAEEHLGDDDRPNQLTGARLLFGYTAAKARQAHKSQGNDGIGEKDFDRFAGRIAFNHAVEVIGNGRQAATLKSRFLYRNDGDEPEDFALPLRILGEPKPSAVEHYLQQNGIERIPGATLTYGDLPGFDFNGTPLNGRKFYRHQPCFPGPGPVPSDAHFLGRKLNDIDERTSRQATLVRFVSRPEVRYHFSVRFRDLRQWELGALLLAMSPHLIADMDAQGLDPALAALIRNAKEEPEKRNDPLFAIKIGYARPLGFGSAHVDLQGAARIGGTSKPIYKSIPENQLADWQKQAVAAYLTQRGDRGAHLVPWLRVVQYAGCTVADYPTRAPTRGAPTIYEYHTQIRREHSELRRSGNATETRNDRPVWPAEEPGEPWQSTTD